MPARDCLDNYGSTPSLSPNHAGGRIKIRTTAKFCLVRIDALLDTRILCAELGSFMDRREALRLLAGSAALPLAAPNVFGVLREARALLGTDATHRTLSSHQSATVTVIAEMVIPRTETPGATDVGVTSFIDLILTEWYTNEDRARFLKGLADVDARSRSSFGKRFIECSADQRAEILTALGTKVGHDADLLKTEPETERAPEAGKNFYYMLRRLVLTGYYTSEAGATMELNYQIIPDRYDGCADVRAGKEAPENR
jgi:glucoside 3-dehydrogenase (cytochrome c) hitch-hiker subunit